MSVSWYVIAHRAGFKIFEQRGVKPDLALVHTGSHPEGRLRDSEIAADRQGRTTHTDGHGHSALSQERSPSQAVTEDYVRLIAHELSIYAQKNSFDSFVLVADPHLLGLLKQHLDKSLAPKLRGTLSKDLAHTPDRDLPEHLAEFMLTREPIAAR